MVATTPVPIAPLPLQRFESVLGPEAYRCVREEAERVRDVCAGRILWNINSTARGGGVAEMLQSLLAYGRGCGVDVRWEVMVGDESFFAVTKRLHNHLHGSPGDGLPLDHAAREIYEAMTRRTAEGLADRISPGDIVLLHDPQTAGMIPVLRELGGFLIWRCHVGIDTPNRITQQAWRFLRGYVAQADAYVFSRRQYVWESLDPDRTVLIAPSIDVFSAKNEALTEVQTHAILAAAGLQEDDLDAGAAVFTRIDGSPARVERRAEVEEDRRLRPDHQLVVQVSRWDRLKDPAGVIDGFVQHVVPHCDAHLLYAGPAVSAVADDPEGRAVLAEARTRRAALTAAARERVHLVALPMADLEENAAIVNALQRRADVVVQKSLAEGFGLTVAEAMWKRRAVVASRIGGIQDQIDDGRSGLLVGPGDLRAYGQAVVALLGDPARATEMGRRAARRVAERFLGTRSLTQYFRLFGRLLDGRPAAEPS
ncbi:glycosyltransferase [Pseudonocardia acidicola]|uniref:Glycosyltransferase n=1 Tax=Pseudonocardia acidicola TaxID=2724939 RepID=A0ABX1SE37_9PSEU|nr:glycosyltransferase [Pseudonocardia acidicola]NMH98458.1 glycosyltransferase [Pseudonocardia acidicola]